MGILKKTQCWNWLAPFLLVVKLVLVLWKSTLVIKPLINGLFTMPRWSHSTSCKTFQVLLNQMETNWSFGLILWRIISCCVPASSFAKLDELYGRETLPRALSGCPWRKSSSSSSFAPISASKHEHVELRSKFWFQVGLNYSFQQINCWPRTLKLSKSIAHWSGWFWEKSRCVMKGFHTANGKRTKKVRRLSFVMKHLCTFCLAKF